MAPRIRPAIGACCKYQATLNDSDPAGVLDMEGRQRADKATGELLWGLDLVALGGKDGAEVWNVRIVGEPKGISTGQPVRVQGLTAMTWEMTGVTASASALMASNPVARRRPLRRRDA